MKLPAPLDRHSGPLALGGVALVLTLLSLMLLMAGRAGYASALTAFSGLRNVQLLARDAGHADSLDALYSRLLANVDSLQRAAPDAAQGSRILSLVAEGAKARGLEIADINALDAVSGSGYTEFPLELGLKGSFPQLGRYLGDLESQGLVVKVRTLSLKAPAMNHPRLEIALGLSVFAPAGN